MPRQRAQMLVVTVICHIDQAFVKPKLVCATFIATDQQDGLPVRIEGKRHPPDLTVPRKPQFFHVGVPRALECVHAGSPQVRTTEVQHLKAKTGGFSLFWGVGA